MKTNDAFHAPPSPGDCANGLPPTSELVSPWSATSRLQHLTGRTPTCSEPAPRLNKTANGSLADHGRSRRQHQPRQHQLDEGWPSHGSPVKKCPVGCGRMPRAPGVNRGADAARMLQHSRWPLRSLHGSSAHGPTFSASPTIDVLVCGRAGRLHFIPTIENPVRRAHRQAHRAPDETLLGRSRVSQRRRNRKLRRICVSCPASPPKKVPRRRHAP